MSSNATTARRLITADVARRIAIAAQGLADRRPVGRVDRRHLRKVFQQVGLVQIDSVNVVARSHELVLFARLGPHRRTLIAEATAAGELFEYWGHEAAHIPVEHHRLFRFRMNEPRIDHWIAEVARELRNDRAGAGGHTLDDVLEHVRTNGPVVASDLRRRSGPKGQWWDWDPGKRALEVLFWQGRLTAYRRARDFARIYDVPERILDGAALDLPTPTEDEARRELLMLAARSLGVATAKDLCDYHRQKARDCGPLLAGLVADGSLEQVLVEGWNEAGYLHPEARRPREIDARALLSPFDSLVWFRPRLERIFGFRYRIEIYTPAARRVHGYYVLPFLLGDQMVARVDLKADRRCGVLRVLGTHGESGIDRSRVAESLAEELREMAEWLGLTAVSVDRNGDLAAALRRAVD